MSAQEGVDYDKYTWRVYFLPGQTEQQFSVMLDNDSHDEGAETFEVVLT